MLEQHGKAVLDRDRATYLSGIVDGALRDDQGVVFDNLMRLPLTHWSYQIGALVDAADAQRAVRKKYDASAVIVRVELSYALARADAIPTMHDLWWTFVQRGGKPVVVGDTDLADSGGQSWRGPWDFGPLAVVTGSSALVLGHDDEAGLLKAIADTIDKAVPVVTSVVGRDWSRYAVVLAPETAQELNAALGSIAPGTSEIGALAVADGTDPLSGKVLGQRLVTEPDQLERLSDVGRRIVLQHELTHLATAAITTDATPRWLNEGFAEYVGNIGSGQPVTEAASELRTEVRRSGPPKGLPDAGAFDASTGAPQAYESAWLACKLIASKYGQRALVTLYRFVGRSSQSSDQAAVDGLRSVLHITQSRFLVLFRAYVRAQLT